MPIFCIPKKAIDSFRTKIKSLKLTELLNMTTEQRTKLLEKYVGKNAKDVNLLFEQKLILKNRLQGLKNWLNKVAELGRYSPEKKAEIAKALDEFQAKQLERIFSPKENEAFLKDLAEYEIGAKITKEEASNVFKMTSALEELRKGYDETKPSGQKWASDEQAKRYGSAKVILENYIEELKTGKLTLKQMLSERWGKFKEEPNKPKAVADLILDTLKTISDNSISMVATFDNSFIGRQGLKTLMTHPKTWLSMAKNSFGDIYKTLFTNKDARDALWADVYSRENYMDGNYDLAKLIPRTEEQFPTSIPERLPIVGKIFKASENAFVGSAIRARMDLFDLISKKAKSNGVDMTDKYQIKSVGKLVNSLTARGQWGKRGEPAFVRLFLWAPRMLKANIDVLTAHTGQDISTFARKQAAINLLKIVGTSAMIMMIANAMKPDSAEIDSRSSDFGKIKVGNTRFDYTGGAASLITLASRLIANSTKSTTTGMVSEFGAGYGQRSRWDIIVDFLTGKTTPPARALIDFLKGRNFRGKVPTVGSSLYQTFTPITIQNAIELKDDDSAEAVLGVLLDIVGINANTYQPYETDWQQSTSKELLQFKEKIGKEKFKEANNLYNKMYNEWYNGVRVNTRFQILDDETKLKVITNKKADIKDDVFKKYRFKYFTPKVPKKIIPKF
uniref:Large polyvalent protein associated domain-containing protein n=1 Tax=viral metagenome TaxID=1070528 RepID=A0A6H1ZG16_9ZZZZ